MASFLRKQLIKGKAKQVKAKGGKETKQIIADKRGVWTSIREERWPGTATHHVATNEKVSYKIGYLLESSDQAIVMSRKLMPSGWRRCKGMNNLITSRRDTTPSKVRAVLVRDWSNVKPSIILAPASSVKASPKPCNSSRSSPNLYIKTSGRKTSISLYAIFAQTIKHIEQCVGGVRKPRIIIWYNYLRI